MLRTVTMGAIVVLLILPFTTCVHTSAAECTIFRPEQASVAFVGNAHQPTTDLYSMGTGVAVDFHSGSTIVTIIFVFWFIRSAAFMIVVGTQPALEIVLGGQTTAAAICLVIDRIHASKTL